MRPCPELRCLLDADHGLPHEDNWGFYWSNPLHVLLVDTNADEARLAAAIHSECVRHWNELWDEEPERLITQHLPDAHAIYAARLRAALRPDPER